MTKKQIFGIILSILVLISMFFITPPDGLSEAGLKSFMVLIAVVIMLITEPLAFGVICILGLALLVICGAAPNMNAALSGYTNHILFFVLISFGISAAFTKVNLSKKLLMVLIKTFGFKSKNILFSVMLCAALLSSVMSNVASAAILMGVVNDILQLYPETERKAGAKSFMIGLPMACIYGGMMTPAGNSLNLLVLDALEKSAGLSVSFVEWMAIGIPMALFALLLSWLLLLRVFPPCDIAKEDIEAYIKENTKDKKLTASERYVLRVMIALFALWVLSSWIPALNITVVGIIGFTLFFIPKFNVLTWKDFTDSVSWPAFFLIGSMMSFGNILTENNVGQFLMQKVFVSVSAPGAGLAVFLCATFVSVMLVGVPIAPALITMLAVPFISLAECWGYSPVLLIMTLILCSVNSLHLPLDTVPLMTYMSGYYKMSDMTKVGVPVELCFNVVLAFWLPFVLKITGLS